MMSRMEGPDHGHAWVIAFMAFIITMILSGISKMVGILYVAVIDTYGVTRQMATLPFTFRKSIRSLAGPIVGVIGQRFGVRSVTMCGAVVAALGPALAFFAPDVAWLAFCWGGIHGLGEAFANTLFQVVVNQHFEKYRSTASGIAMSGACFGSIFFSFLIEALRDEYGLQGTFLVLAGVILNVVPAGIMLKPPTWSQNNTKAAQKESNLKQSIHNQPQLYTIPTDYVKSNAEKQGNSQRQMDKNEIMSLTNSSKTNRSTANLVQTFEKKLLEKKGSDNLAFAVENQKTPLERQLSVNSIKNIFPTSYDRSVSVNSTKNNSFQKLSFESTKDINTQKRSTVESIKDIFRLYKSPMFLLVCVSMVIYVFVFIPVNTSMVDYTKDKGLPETYGKYLIHAMAVGDITGRLCLGWVTDKHFVSIPHYIALALLLQGCFIIALPFASSFVVFLILLGCYSMCTGSMLVRLPIVVLKSVQKDQESVAIGCYGFASGLVPFGVPFLIGQFRDNFGSYDGMYYLLGCLSLVSSIFWICEPLISRLGEKKIEENLEKKEGV